MSNNSKFLQIADRIGSRVCRDAIFASGSCNWIGSSIHATKEGQTVIQRALKTDLYEGTSGVALFLSHLAAQTNEAIHRRTALAALRQVRTHLHEMQLRTDIGFYSGTTGLAFILIDVGELFDDDVLVGLGLRILKDLGSRGEESSELDIISGFAGSILSLLAIYKRYPEPHLIELASRFGKRLVEAGHWRNQVCSWKTMNIPTIDDLTGFSHGASGIALALLELSVITGDERLRCAGEAGFEYEREHFSAQQDNWPDFRIFGHQMEAVAREPSYPIAWCHGAPGIGLARLRAYQLTQSPVMRREAYIALRTTTRALRDPEAMSGSCALCHGVLGNTELLLRTAEIFNDDDCRQTAEALVLELADRYLEDGAWPCGIPGGAQTPSLMLGLAGIGYQYLRIYDPERNPSVLLVAS